MSVPRLREGLCVREIDGEAVLLDRQREMMHSFNPTAACILHAIDGARTEREISEVLRDRFEVNVETALNDTRQVIQQLRELGLLQDAPAEQQDPSPEQP